MLAVTYRSRRREQLARCQRVRIRGLVPGRHLPLGADPGRTARTEYRVVEASGRIHRDPTQNGPDGLCSLPQRVSRSGLVSTAYLMYEHEWTQDQALAFVRSKRPGVWPNPAFTPLLREWEQALKEPARQTADSSQARSP